MTMVKIANPRKHLELTGDRGALIGDKELYKFTDQVRPEAVLLSCGEVLPGCL
jgi:hypothetical protein